MRGIRKVSVSFGRLSLLAGVLMVSPANWAVAQPVTVNLSSFGFPPGQVDLPSNVFYISSDLLAIYFDRGEATDAPQQNNHPRPHAFLILVFNKKGQVLAQQTIYGFPKALDIKAGPDDGIIVGREGSMSFYGADLLLRRSMPLASNATGVSYDRRWNQLAVETIDDASQSRTVNLLDGVTLKPLESFTLPERVPFITGNREIAYTVGGDCRYSTRILSNERSWNALRGLPTCGFIAFTDDETLAYAFEQQLYLVSHLGKRISRQTIPAFDQMNLPSYNVISNDGSRVAIWVWKRRLIRKQGEYPEYREVFVYDLHSHARVFSHPLITGTAASALSLDGKQLVTIDDGLLSFYSLP